ncbi:MAG: hypothetical protein NC936_05270, partial [Candidatus Omnitrophica bacterium]|nr:hypothetical protein [Candidatus Omnitrophota bacterium]
MRHSPKEYLVYFSVRILMFVFSWLPIEFALFIGKIIGRLQFYLDIKHRTVAYKNLKLAFAREKTPDELKKILKKNFQNFAQNFIELLYLKKIDQAYIKRYIKLEGRQYIEDAFRKKRGVIFVGAHEGSWELSNAGFALLGYPFSIIAETQRNQLLNQLLDKYRRSKGCGVIPNNTMLRQLIKNLKKNEAVGIVIDHGGLEEGILVEFFNRQAFTPVGAVRLALKYDIPLLLGYVYRIKGPYHKIVMLP